MISRIYFVLLILVTSSLFGEYVTISNAEGREIEVELLELEGDEVTFAMRNGREFTVGMDTLSASSRKLIKKWDIEANKVLLKKDDRLKVLVHTRRDSDDTDGGYTGWKDMDERIEPRVVIENEEYKRSYKKLKAKVALIAEDVTNRNRLKVVFLDSFDFNVSYRSSYEWLGDAFTLDYLIDDNDGYDNSYGYRYRYYYVVIRNADGSFGKAFGSVSKWERDPTLIDKLKLNQVYSRDLR